MTKHQLEHSDQVLTNVHPPDRCAGEQCTIHNMSDHHMRSFPQHWREDRGIMERTCPHGVGHPDPDSPWPWGPGNWVHGCDGCCNPNRIDLSEDIVDTMKIFAELADNTDIVVTMIKGSIFAEAAQIIEDMRLECEQWEERALLAYELLAGKSFDNTKYETFDQAIDDHRRALGWEWPYKG